VQNIVHSGKSLVRLIDKNLQSVAKNIFRLVNVEENVITVHKMWSLDTRESNYM
jgi:hypothetical protein